MCAYYDDKQKIKKGDAAVYQNQNIIIISAKHIRENKTMDITYCIQSTQTPIEHTINIPYKTTGYNLSLKQRKI